MTLVKVHPLCVLVWWHDRSMTARPPASVPHLVGALYCVVCRLLDYTFRTDFFASTVNTKAVLHAFSKIETRLSDITRNSPLRSTIRNSARPLRFSPQNQCRSQKLPKSAGPKGPAQEVRVR